MPKEYAIGFPPDFRNDNGGIAIGYGYDPAGNINRAVCGGTLWSTGEQLRNARDRAIIQRLQPGGPLIVDGLQGNSTRLLRPLNEPPFETYFIDYDDRFDDPQTRGTMGDVVIWRVCGQAALPIVPVVRSCVRRDCSMSMAFAGSRPPVPRARNFPTAAASIAVVRRAMCASAENACRRR